MEKGLSTVHLEMGQLFSEMYVVHSGRKKIVQFT